MTPAWLTRALDRCESCSLDNADDRARLAEAIMDELPAAAIVRVLADRIGDEVAARQMAHAILLTLTNEE